MLCRSAHVRSTVSRMLDPVVIILAALLALACTGCEEDDGPNPDGSRDPATILSVREVDTGVEVVWSRSHDVRFSAYRLSSSTDSAGTDLTELCRRTVDVDTVAVVEPVGSPGSPVWFVLETLDADDVILERDQAPGPDMPMIIGLSHEGAQWQLTWNRTPLDSFSSYRIRISRRQDLREAVLDQRTFNQSDTSLSFYELRIGGAITVGLDICDATDSVLKSDRVLLHLQEVQTAKGTLFSTVNNDSLHLRWRSLCGETIEYRLYALDGERTRIDTLLYIGRYCEDTLVVLPIDHIESTRSFQLIYEYSNGCRDLSNEELIRSNDSDMATYYPLHVGDYWNYTEIYHVVDQGIISTREYRVEIDSLVLMPNRLWYYTLNNAYERLDSRTGKIYSYCGIGEGLPFDEVLLEDLEAQIDVAFPGYRYSTCEQSWPNGEVRRMPERQVIVFGQSENCMNFFAVEDTDYPYPNYDLFYMDGIGLCYARKGVGMTSAYMTSLSYCRIGGHVYN